MLGGVETDVGIIDYAKAKPTSARGSVKSGCHPENGIRCCCTRQSAGRLFGGIVLLGVRFNQTDRVGAFEVRGMMADTYEVRIQVPGFKSVTVRAGATEGDADTRTVVLEIALL